MASPHFNALSARHAQIDGQITAEMTRPIPDTAKIGEMKRLKLKLKEEMSRLQ